MSFGQAKVLVPFDLRDQFDVLHSSKAISGQSTVIIVSDREGSTHSENWGRAIQTIAEELPNSHGVAILAVAHVENVPPIFRSFVRKMIKRDRLAPVLLDWKGQFNRLYGVKPSLVNVFVFSTDGKLQLHIADSEIKRTTLNSIKDCLNMLTICE